MIVRPGSAGRRLRLALGPALWAAAGCSPGVAVRHPVAPLGIATEDVPKLSRMAIVMTVTRQEAAKAGATAGNAALGQFLESLGSDNQENSFKVDLSPAQAHETLRAAGRQIESPYSHLVGVEVEGPYTLKHLEMLQPTTVLWVVPGQVEASQGTRQIQRYNRKTKKSDPQTVWDCAAQCAYNWRVETWPDRRPLAGGSTVANSAETFDQPQVLSEWAGKQAGWRAGWVAAVRGQILPRVATLWRRAWKADDVKADHSGCYLAWNQAVEVERAGRWQDAKAGYQRALQLARTDKDRNYLNRYILELASVSESPAVAASSVAWFADPVAVAPFGNETNSVQAPEVARQAVEEWVGSRGYRMMPHAQTEEGFHNLGVSQGDQLKATTPARIAASLGVKRWIEGTVNEFKIINVGVYYRRQARVTLRMVDATGAVLWEAAGVSVKQAAGTKNILGTLAAGLAESMLEKLTKTYLKEDTQEAARQSLAFLPAR